MVKCYLKVNIHYFKICIVNSNTTSKTFLRKYNQHTECGDEIESYKILVQNQRRMGDREIKGVNIANRKELQTR